MEISLAPRQEAFIREQLETGHYVDASEIVREALRQLECRCRTSDSDRPSDMGEMESLRSLRLQMAMDRMSKLIATLSNLLRKMSDTAASITQNLK